MLGPSCGHLCRRRGESCRAARVQSAVEYNRQRPAKSGHSWAVNLLFKTVKTYLDEIYGYSFNIGNLQLTMRIRKKISCTLLILSSNLIFPMLAHSAPAAQTPEEVATLFLQARQRADWKGALEFVSSEEVEKLHPYALTVFEDEGKKRNILRKFFLGAEVTSDAVRTLPHKALVGSYLEFLHLLRSSRSGTTEFLGFRQLNSFMEGPDLANVVVRENASYLGAEYQTSSIIRLRRIAQRWYASIEEEIFLSEVTKAQARRMLENGTYRFFSIDLRPMTHEQRMVAFNTALKKLSFDRSIKYELVVGKNTDLSAELKQIATILNLHYRIEFVENPVVKSDAQ